MKGERLMAQDYGIYNLEKGELKIHYIEIIIKLLNQCDDISLLDLIKKLLEKSV